MINKYKKIHITGASGTGTTSLGKELSKIYKIPHFDSDDFLWLPSIPLYEKLRERKDRENLLMSKISTLDSFILSGSNSGWGDCLIPYYDLVIFLSLDTEKRLKRIENREVKRFGKEYLLTQKYKDFIMWSKEYQ